MIEVNKRAKPFHPCEELLGTELLFLTKRCQLIGRNYYAPQYPTNKKDVMCQFKGSLVANGLVKGLKKHGFYEKMTNVELPQFYQFVKEDGANIIQMYVSPNNWMYDEMARTAEICKYLQFFAAKNTPLSKDLVLDIHQLNTGNWGCRSVNDGAEVELFQLPPQQDDAPMPAPVPHQWNHFANAAENAAIAQQAAVAGAGQWHAGGGAQLAGGNEVGQDALGGLVNQLLGG